MSAGSDVIKQNKRISGTVKMSKQNRLNLQVCIYMSIPGKKRRTLIAFAVFNIAFAFLFAFNTYGISSSLMPELVLYIIGVGNILGLAYLALLSKTLADENANLLMGQMKVTEDEIASLGMHIRRSFVFSLANMLLFMIGALTDGLMLKSVVIMSIIEGFSNVDVIFYSDVDSAKIASFHSKMFNK